MVERTDKHHWGAWIQRSEIWGERDSKFSFIGGGCIIALDG